MNSNIGILSNSSNNNLVRYSTYDTHLTDATIYMENRKNYVRSEMINLDFMYIQDIAQNECVKPLAHIKL